MSGFIYPLLIVVALTLFILKFRVPSALVFFSLLVGQLLAENLADDVFLSVNSYAGNGIVPWIQPALLFLPAILTLVFLRGSVGKAKMLVELAPAILTGVSAVLLLDPLLSSLRQNGNGVLWQNIDTYKSLLFFAASITSLFTSWFTFPKSRFGKRHS